MSNGSGHSIYVFDRFRLDRDRLMLYRDETEVVLPPKAVETLSILAEHHGEIISKDELIEALWTDSIVEESNLSQYLYLLRKTLGSRPDGKPYIETLRRRGYRFTADVRLFTEAPARVSIDGDNTIRRERRTVERHGNVLALVDWHEAEPRRTDVAPLAEPASPPQTWPRYRPIATGVVAVCLLTAASLVVAFVWYGSVSVPQPVVEHRGEMTIERLTNGLSPRCVAISPDGKYFTYDEQDGDTAHFWVQQTGQSTRVEVMPPSERVIGDKTFSPDGRFIYFTAANKGETRVSLFRVPTLGGAQAKLVDNVSTPVSFSPDGREIVFSRYDEKTRGYWLIIASSDGGEERILLTGDPGRDIIGYPAWSPDGKEIAYGIYTTPTDRPGGCTLKAVQPDGANARTLSEQKWDTCYRSAWLKDGKKLVFIGTKEGESITTRREQIYLVSTVTGETRRLTFNGNRHHLGSISVTNDDAVLAVPFNRSSQIWVIDPNGDTRSAVQITNGIADGRAGIAPMTDGRVAYLARAGENLNIWTMNADGSGQKQLVSEPPFAEELRASADGRYFIFSSPVGRVSQLFRVDTTGDNLRQLTFGDVRAIDSTVSHDAKFVVYDGGFYEGPRQRFPLFKMPIDGGEPVRLTEQDCGTPHYSPDGRFISCIVDYSKEIAVVTSDGVLVKTFAAKNLPVMNIGVRWTPDGKNLVYIVQQKDVNNLWLQSINGVPPRQLTNFTSGQIHNFAFSADGTRLFLSRGAHQQNDAILIRRVL